MAPVGADGQGQGIPQEVRRRRRGHRDREGRRHLRLHGRRARLRVRAGKEPRRESDLDRDLEGPGPDQTRRPVRRQAQDAHRLSRPHRDGTRAVGRSLRSGEIQRSEPRHRPLHRRAQDVSHSVPEAAPRPHLPHPRQGQDDGRRERAVWPGGHADQGSAAGDPGQQVEDSGHDRIRIPHSAGIRQDDRADQVPAVPARTRC